MALGVIIAIWSLNSSSSRNLQRDCTRRMRASQTALVRLVDLNHRRLQTEYVRKTTTSSTYTCVSLPPARDPHFGLGAIFVRLLLLLLLRLTRQQHVWTIVGTGVDDTASNERCRKE